MIKTMRIHLNKEDEGTLWWAEGGDYVGGSEELRRLVEDIQKWAEDEGDEITIQLADATEPRPITTQMSLAEWTGFETLPKNEGSGRGRYVARILPVTPSRRS